MASTYSSLLRLELMATGDQSGTWGVTNNTNLGTLIDQAIAGRAAVSMGSDADYTLTANNGATDEARQMILNIASGVALTATRNVICPTSSKVYIVKNATTGGQSIIFKTSAGTGVTISNGQISIVFCDGTNVVSAVAYPVSVANGGTGLTAAGTSGNVLTSDGSSWVSSAPAAPFTAGTVMLFQQTAAPTGWTKLVTNNDKALRIVSGTASTGGSTAFTSVFGAGKSTASYTLLAADIPAHTHTFSGTTSGQSADHTHSIDGKANNGSAGPLGGADPFGGFSTNGASNDHTHSYSGTTSSVGSSGGHSHTLSLDLQYVDVIAASKN